MDCLQLIAEHGEEAGGWRGEELGGVMGGVRGGKGVRWESGGMGSWRLMGRWWVGRSGNVFSKVDGERGLKIHSHMVFWRGGLGKRKGSG